MAGSWFLSSCSGDTSGQNVESPSVSAEVSEARMTEVPKTYRFTGTVAGDERINLSTKVMGYVSELNADLGDAVARGDVLLRIKNDNLLAQRRQVEANLAEARAALKNTQTNYNRIKALFEDSSATQKEVDDITTQLESASARVQALESKLAEVRDLIAYSVIESPINGYVVQKMVNQGDMASPGQPLLAVEEVDNLEVLVSVPASQIGLFSAGDTLDLYIGSVREYLAGTVRSVNPSADMRSRQFEVKVSIPAETVTGTRVKPGMFADVMLKKGTESILTVPEDALVRKGQLTGLYTLNSNDELLLRWVTTGHRVEDQQVEILSGISEGERFVIAGDRKYREGQQVTIQ
ncbi:MAG: efflux RND transporter periplasmic adaptor subunit [Balneolaceae bacterium]|nr:efflux RND transporter periplasmic adaptor subunit [Balneolaceae bacterium]